jgi:hypothetical protein
MSNPNNKQPASSASPQPSAPTPQPSAPAPTGKTSAIIFDDGSLECKCLKHELSDNPDFDVQVIPVEPKIPDLEKADKVQLEDYLKKAAETAPKEKDKLTNVWLHFAMEDYNKFALNDQINASASKYPNIQVIKAYELMWRPAIKNNAKQYGLDLEININDQRGTSSTEDKPPA